jgi:hypothetical protein
VLGGIGWPIDAMRDAKFKRSCQVCHVCTRLLCSAHNTQHTTHTLVVNIVSCAMQVNNDSTFRPCLPLHTDVSEKVRVLSTSMSHLVVMSHVAVLLALASLSVAHHAVCSGMQFA